MIDIRHNVILRDFVEESKAEGRVEGRTEGMTEVLRGQLKAKFGPLPKWAQERLAGASTVQLERWVKRILTAKTLEGALDKK